MKTLVITQGEDDYVRWAARYGDVEMAYEFRDAEPIIRRREVDVVLFTGGEDVAPMLYGEVTDYRTSYSQRRDWREMGIYRACEHSGVSTFGICRGAQFVAVMRGATLHQHIDGHAIGSSHYSKSAQHEPLPVSFWDYFSFGELPPALMLNSTHHQAVNLLTAKLSGALVLYKADATEEEKKCDIAEAAAWEIGLRRDAIVQWHPEYMRHVEPAQGVAANLLQWAARA